jgi:hypothetical protein
MRLVLVSFQAEELRVTRRNEDFEQETYFLADRHFIGFNLEVKRLFAYFNRRIQPLNPRN